MSQAIICPACQSDFTYENEGLMVCSQCFHEWKPADAATSDADTASAAPFKVIDALGNELQDGDTVVITKDLPVKGMPKSVKAGTKVKNIRLTAIGDHNIDCKIDGFGAMALKSEFVRKA